MPKLSAGIMLYRRQGGDELEIFLVHPGGPFWATKDAGSWSIPKGEYGEGEAALEAARREFAEETGLRVPEGECVPLGEVSYGNKRLSVWALEGNADAKGIRSNTFAMEWPPKTGRRQDFAEVDRADWFGPDEARRRLVKGQAVLVDRLSEQLGISVRGDKSGEQISML